MVAGDDQRRIEVGGAYEVGDVDVVQMLCAADVGGGVSRLVADVDDYSTLLAQGLGLFGGIRLNSVMAGSYGLVAAGWVMERRDSHWQSWRSPVSMFIRVMAPPHTQPVSRANTPGSSHLPSSAAQ